MPDTIGTISSLLRERFPDLSSARAEDYIIRVHREICGAIPEISRKSIDIDLTAGIGVYDLPADTLEVAHVIYAKDASTRSQVLRTTQDELGEKKPLWGFDPSGTPSLFYVQTELGLGVTSDLKITLYPKPDTTTTGGYPVLHVYITEVMPLATDDPLPEGLAGYGVYLEGASYYAAMALRDPDAAGTYLSLYQGQIEMNRDRWRRRVPQFQSDSTYPLNRRK